MPSRPDKPTRVTLGPPEPEDSTEFQAQLKAKVARARFEAPTRRVGSLSPAAVIEVGLAALAVQDDLGPWLAEQWGTLAELDPEILDQLEI